MFINTKNLFKLPEPLILPLLLVLKQASKKDVSKELQQLTYNNDILKKIESLGYIKYIKGNKSDTIFNKMRLDKKGTQFLRELDEPDVLEEDIQFSTWLINLYKSKGKAVKSSKKLQRLIAWFRETTGIDKNKLGYLLKCFIAEQEKYDFEYSHDVNNVFWKPSNLFQTKPNLEDSRLYLFYISDKVKFDQTFKTL